MRSSRHLIAACATCAGLLVPALALAADDAADPPVTAGSATTLTPGNVRPDAALSSVVNGEAVSFDASASTDSDGGIASYEWDLDGDSVFETDTGTDPRVQRDYPAGTTLIAAVRVTDDAGASDDATAAVGVAAAPEDPQPAPGGAPLVPTNELETADADPAEPAEPAEPRPARRKRATTEAADPPVNAAANNAVTIKDFSYAPATVNIKVGDSVTWLNQGPTDHTATASDGSFDSGNLTKGKSYSRTFNSAGTFSYICKPHPFMKGRVVVTGSGSGGGSGGGAGAGSGDDSGSGGGSGDTAGATGTESDSGGSGGLANTGVDLVPWSLFGLSLLAFGAALRFRLTD